MQFGSAGGGSATHITCVLLNVAIGVDVTHVPYRGTGPAMQDLIGGRIDYICDVISTALAAHPQRIGQGDRAAVATAQQCPAGPRDRARAGPRGFRRRRLERLLPAAWHARSDRAAPRQGDERRARLPWVRERLEGLGLNVTPPERRTPEYLARLIPSELVKWAEAVKASGAVGAE